MSSRILISSSPIRASLVVTFIYFKWHAKNSIIFFSYQFHFIHKGCFVLTCPSKPKGARDCYSWPAMTMEADQRFRRSGRGGSGGGRPRCRVAPSFANNRRTVNDRGMEADVGQFSWGRGRHGCGNLCGSSTPLLSIILFLCYMPLPGKIISRKVHPYTKGALGLG